MPYEGKIKLEELPETQKKNISRIMQDPEFVKLYALIEKATNMHQCRFNYKYEEGPAMSLPGLAKMRTTARLVAARTYMLSEKKEYGKALQSVGTGLRFGNFLSDEPLIISQLVRIAIDDISVKSLNLFINRKEVILSDKDYSKLISLVERKNRAITKAFEGEIVFHIFESRTNLAAFFDSISPSHGNKGLNIFSNLYGSYLGHPILKADHAFYIRTISLLENYSRKPYFLVRDKYREWDRKIYQDRFHALKHIISSMTLPALDRVLQIQANNDARLDSFKLALALKIYREKHGSYPDSLAPLVPGIIPDIPLDPFTGKDYIYRREGKGLIVYSIGPNEKDDNGINNPEQKQDDIAFKVTN
ncbi:MAG TPA: hypothetical protein PKN36_11035 [bacterium]|nr:hypothetical protein [bacterium]